MKPIMACEIGMVIGAIILYPFVELRYIVTAFAEVNIGFWGLFFLIKIFKLKL